MKHWQRVWREGFAPLFSTDALRALKHGLETDDIALVQGATTVPPPLMCVADWPCEGACGVTYAGWKGEDLHTVGDAEAFFAKCCYEVDELLKESAACRFFLNWFDDTPRPLMIAELSKEVAIELEKRGELHHVSE